MLTKTFDTSPEIIMEHVSDLGLTLTHFEFLGLYLDMFDKNWSFVPKKLRFWSNTGSKTQNVEKLSLDLIYSIIISGKISKVLVTEAQVNNSP